MFAVRFVPWIVAPICVFLLAETPRAWNFDSDKRGSLPEGWVSDKTRSGPGSVWKVLPEEAGAKPNQVLAQVSSEGQKTQFNVCILKDIELQDLALSVGILPRTGKIDRGGGLVWRYRDSQNYYICRWNPLEDNFRLYQVAGGKRIQMDTAKIKLDPQSWHTLRVMQVGRDARCYLDGRLLLEAEDDTFPNAGQVGVWTKSDAVTWFDDFTVRAANADDLEEPVSWHDSGSQGAVAAGGAEAVSAGIEILQQGGNAVDAAVATILALSVTDSGGFCFGGEVPILVYDARRKVVEVLSGQGAAPRLATREYFAAKGGIPRSGLEAAAVPAALDACLTALDRYGTLKFADVAAPVLRILDRHAEEWHALLATTLRRLVAAEKESRADRRRGLRHVADYFYRGPLARELDAWCQAQGGLIRYSDLATHTTRIEDPVSITYRGHTVCKCGPWTQGPYLLQTLRLLEGVNLKTLGHNRPGTIHVMVEALKLAFADRDVYYADPLFADVPMRQLLSDHYTWLRRPLIDPNKASLTQQPGDPLRNRPLLSAREARRGLSGPVHDTTTCVVADRWGNMVAATPSGWSGVLAGDTGIWLGSRLQSFNTWEGHPNCIQPGKRPRITLTPTLVLKDGRPVLACSVAGGDGQDQATLQMVVNQIDFRLSPAESMSAIRFGTNHHLGSFGQTAPELGSLLIYPESGAATIGALEALGHLVKPSGPPLWSPVVIRADPVTGQLDAAGDPKAGRHAAAY